MSMDMLIMSISRKCKCLKKPPPSNTGNLLPRPPAKAAGGAPAVVPNPIRPRPTAVYHSAIQPPSSGLDNATPPAPKPEPEKEMEIAPPGVESRRRRRPPPQPNRLTDV